MRILFAAFLTASAVALSATPASATSIAISACYTGACASLTGQVNITITDDNGPNQNPGSVDDLKVVIQNNTNGFIDQVGLFYTGGLPANTTIEGFSGTGGTGEPGLSFTLCATDNSAQASNTCFNFQQPNASRFDAGDTATFYLDSDTVALLSASFSSTLGFAHINEIGGAEGPSAKINATTPGGPPPPPPAAVPEPTSLFLLGSGALFVARRARRKLS